MTLLQRLMLSHNPFVALYVQARELTRETPLPDYRLRLDFLRATDRRRYNLPTSQNELAAIIPGDVDTCVNSRDIIVRAKGGALLRMTEIHRFYTALHFPLLAPTGQSGWDPAMHYAFLPSELNQRRTHAFLSFCDFLKHRLHVRPVEVESDHYFRAGFLLQEFIVDMWAAAEHSRLEWVRNHQDTIRAELYSGLVDALREGQDLSSIGRKVVLPSSFTSGPRFMQRKLQDALALLRIFKGSDLFITFTANPAWREIQEALLPGQKACDRPDIVARVFHLKVLALLDDIMKRHVFGEAVAHVYTLEYQKRGLPHIHLIVFLHPDARLSTPERVDALISTEFPDESEQPELLELVKTHMVHGPCGPSNYSPCLDDKNECTRKFPRPFQDETDISGDAYAKTRRRNTGKTFCVRNTVVDNRNVVSYSPYLLSRYHAHINVECTSGFNAIKYIYKYVYKGPDRATLALHGGSYTGDASPLLRDEIRLYLDARYVSASEAYARVMGWATHQEYPPVQQLLVHLEDEQSVTFRPDAPHTLRGIERNTQDTQLTGFFKANRKYPATRELCYVDFPSKFVWDTNTREWRPRKQITVYGRLVFVPPNAGDRFYARLILSVAKNLQSFRDLRTYNGVVYDTIREACLARGLLDDDGEWRHCLEEGKYFQTGFILRCLFIIILRDCTPSEPVALWHEFKCFLCDDLSRRLARLGICNVSDDIVHDYGLHLIQETLLWESNRSMKDVGMISPVRDWNTLLSNSLVKDQVRYDPEEEASLLQQCLPLLNGEQQRAFSTITTSIRNEGNEAFFVVGAAGAGKTFLYNTLCHDLRSRNLTVLCVAHSGIAALLLPGGRTAHSTFKIPLDLFDDSVCAIPKSTTLARFLTTVDLLIWDECSAQHRHAFEAVDRTLQDIRDNTSIFGGITAVLGGDFLQTLPVIKRGSRSQVVHASLLSSPLWNKVEPNVLKLEKNMRVGNSDADQAFAEWLRKMANGSLNDEEELIELPSHVICPGNSVSELMMHVYPTPHALQQPSFYQERCILSPRNTDAHDLNDCVLDSFVGDTIEMWACDEALDPSSHLPDDTDYPPEVLHSITPSGFPLAQLKLKKGCPIIILRNLQPKEGVCNGTRGILKDARTHVLEVELFSGKTILIPRIKLISTDIDRPFLLRRLQFPVALCFAMTINKSQGQTFEVVGVDLRHPVFGHGQLYVALSRARHYDSLRCITNQNENTGKTKNVVFREVVI